MSGANESRASITSPLLSIPEAIEYLKLGQSTLYERFNEFDVVRLGRRKFITRVSADRYIAANTSKAHQSQRIARRVGAS
jgi:hypothetical protein